MRYLLLCIEQWRQVRRMRRRSNWDDARSGSDLLADWTEEKRKERKWM